jgi:hypothetical protein
MCLGMIIATISQYFITIKILIAMFKNLLFSLIAFLSANIAFAGQFNPEGAPSIVAVGRTYTVTFTHKDFVVGTPGSNFYVPFTTGSTISVSPTGATTTTPTIAGTGQYAIQVTFTVTSLSFSLNLTSDQTTPVTIAPYTFSPLVLPVELTRFEGTTANSAVNLRWATASETNNEKFIIERSYNGKDFLAIGEIAGAGSTTKAQEYIFADKAATASAFATAYYRLVTVSFDGLKENTKQIAVRLRNNDNKITHIAPAASLFSFNSENSSDVEIAVYSLAGQLVAQRTVFATKGLNQIDFDFNAMPAGIYVATLKTTTGAASMKFVK